jgi:hypothetical protein
MKKKNEKEVKWIIALSSKECPYKALFGRCVKQPYKSIWAYAKCNEENCPISIRINDLIR